RHQEENAVEITFFRHNALFTEKVGDHGRRHTEVQVLAGPAINAGCQQRELVGIDHRIAGGVAGVAVPGEIGVDGPALLLGFDDLGRQSLPTSIGDVLNEHRAADRDQIGYERLKEPPLLTAVASSLVVASELPQLLAHLDAQLYAAIP